MLMNFQQEQEKIESLHLELAKKYQVNFFLFISK